MRAPKYEVSPIRCSNPWYAVTMVVVMPSAGGTAVVRVFEVSVVDVIDEAQRGSPSARRSCFAIFA